MESDRRRVFFFVESASLGYRCNCRAWKRALCATGEFLFVTICAGEIYFGVSLQMYEVRLFVW